MDFQWILPIWIGGMARKPHHQMPSAHSQQERFGARDEPHGTGKVTSAVARNHAAILRAITIAAQGERQRKGEGEEGFYGIKGRIIR